MDKTGMLNPFQSHLRENPVLQSAREGGSVRQALIPGHRYIPNKIFHGVCVPLEVLRWPGLPDLAKLAFAVVCGQLGDNSVAVLYLADLAADLGVSIDTASRAIRQLEDRGLLTHNRTGRGNEYFCLWQPRLAACLATAHDALKGLEPGSVYNPWKKFLFALVPTSLVRCHNLTNGAKLLFGLVACHSRNGRCYATDMTLASELGKSKQQIWRHRAELESIGLMVYWPRSEKDKYHFIFRDMLTSSLRPV